MRLTSGILTLGLATALSAQTTAAPSTDVYVYRFDRPQDGVLNITKRAGYDNQPSFIDARLAWTSQRDGQYDIYWLNLEVEKP